MSSGHGTRRTWSRPPLPGPSGASPFSENPVPALASEALETVLRSLSVFYLDRFAYTGSRPQRWRLGEPADLEIIDRGGAIVILAVKNAAAELARGLHGREAAALLRRIGPQRPPRARDRGQVQPGALAIVRVIRPRKPLDVRQLAV